MVFLNSSYMHKNTVTARSFPLYPTLLALHWLPESLKLHMFVVNLQSLYYIKFMVGLLCIVSFLLIIIVFDIIVIKESILVSSIFFSLTLQVYTFLGVLKYMNYIHTLRNYFIIMKLISINLQYLANKCQRNKFFNIIGIKNMFMSTYWKKVFTT